MSEAQLQVWGCLKGWYTGCAAALFLTMVGCSDESGGDHRGAVQTERHVDTPAEQPQTPDQGNDVNRVQNIALPEKKGMQLRYRSDILTFNVLGDMSAGPFTPQRVLEYRLADSLRAVVVLDELTGIYLTVIYEEFGEGRKTWFLDSEGIRTSAWLLRGELDEDDARERLQQLVANQKDPENAFRLTGTITITLRDGYVSDLSLAGVSTVALMPPDKARLRAQADFWRHQARESSKQAVANPNNETLKHAVRQAADSVHHFERVSEAKPEAPARFTDGRVAAEWARRGPKLQIDLP